MLISHYHNIPNYFTFNGVEEVDYLIITDYYTVLYPRSTLWGINVTLSYEAI